jgi:uroporphyrinogen decarboxylase
MTSKDRIRRAYTHQEVDRVPVHFESTDHVRDLLIEHYKVDNLRSLLTIFEVDLIEVEPVYIGPTFNRVQLTGRDYTKEELFGAVREYRWNGIEYNDRIIGHPLKEATHARDVEQMIKWPKKEWFDYESIKWQLDKIENYGSIFGHWGPFQTSTYLYPEEMLYLDMALNPELCHAIFNRMHKFELMHYEQILKAGEGRIDILRTHDDYGSQMGMLFSVPMWKEFFARHTRELADLAHSYGAYFQQHSCGNIRKLIPELISCSVDGLEPIQPVEGMEPEELYKYYGKQLCFVGGIDTQDLLPNGTPEDVRKEVKRYIEAFHAKEGGYILFPSQSWESCVPIANIEAFYQADRR